MTQKTCSKCFQPNNHPNQSYCSKCNSIYQKSYRLQIKLQKCQLKKELLQTKKQLAIALLNNMSKELIP